MHLIPGIIKNARTSRLTHIEPKKHKRHNIHIVYYRQYFEVEQKLEYAKRGYLVKVFLFSLSNELEYYDDILQNFSSFKKNHFTGLAYRYYICSKQVLV